MVSKSAFILSVFAVMAQVAVATPPACLLAAVNTQKQPWNLEAVCGSARQIGNQIQSLCGGNAQAAMSAFQQTCRNAGHAVADVSSTSSTGSSGSSSGSASATSSRAAHTPTDLNVYTMTTSVSSSSMAVATSSSGVAAPTGGYSEGPASNGTSTSPDSPYYGGGAPTTVTPSVPLSTGAAPRTESQGLVGLVFAAAGLIFLL